MQNFMFLSEALSDKRARELSLGAKLMYSWLVHCCCNEGLSRENADGARFVDCTAQGLAREFGCDAKQAMNMLAQLDSSGFVDVRTASGSASYHVYAKNVGYKLYYFS